MAVNVDPFVIQWPEKWIKDPELGPTIQYLNKFLYDLWLRTGGGRDEISNAGLRELYPWGVEQGVNGAELISLFSGAGLNTIPEKRYYSVSASHTTTGNEVIEATAELTVTLNSTPALLESVSVKRNGTGIVTIAGTIDGDTNFQLLYDDESVDLVYNGASWLII